MHKGMKNATDFLQLSITAFPYVAFVSDTQINVGVDEETLPLFTIEPYGDGSLRISSIREVWFCENESIKSFLRGAAMAVRFAQPLNDW